LRTGGGFAEIKARLETPHSGKSIKRERIATAITAGNPTLMATVSFQSHVAAGAVGNAAASFVNAAFGRDLWAVPTVLYSNHPAGRAFAGSVVSAQALHEWIAAFDENQLIDRVDRVQSGYLGAPDQAAVVLEVLAAARKSGRGVPYACDPVLGDQAAGLYVPKDVAATIRDTLVPAADIATPNLFELSFLTGAPVATASDVWTAMRALQAVGPRIVVTTSVTTLDTAPDCIDTFLLDGPDGWVVTTPRIVCPAHGAGDVLTAAFFARLAAGEPTDTALSLAVSSVHSILKASGDQLDLALHTARDDLVSPMPGFLAVVRPPS
jgi:pyridoxine kinase